VEVEMNLQKKTAEISLVSLAASSGAWLCAMMSPSMSRCLVVDREVSQYVDKAVLLQNKIPPRSPPTSSDTQHFTFRTLRIIWYYYDMQKLSGSKQSN